MLIHHVCLSHMFMLQALEMKPDDEHCLVIRCKCYLQLGNSQAALTDAEVALEITYVNLSHILINPLHMLIYHTCLSHMIM